MISFDTNVKMEVDVPLNDEDYVLDRAKSAFETDPLRAKAWMITARTLYPNNFCVQFEAYKIERSAGNVKEAAKCFTDLISKFQQELEFWEEINRLTRALRAENSSSESGEHFLCEMFKHITSEVQHKLLLLTADHCEDTLEHCKLLLLLLQRFPNSIPSHGPGLIDTLLSAEKHNSSSNQPVNKYRKLLVCDLIPLLNSDGRIMELTPKILLKVLHKATEYHLTILWASINGKKMDGTNDKGDENWENLFRVFEFVGKQLGWESYLTCFGNNWCKDSYWQKILTICQSKNLNLEDPIMLKQLIYSIALFLLYCLYNYLYCLNVENVPGQKHASYLLVQAFVDPDMPQNSSQKDANGKSSNTKRRKSDVDASTPFISTEKTTIKSIIGNFSMAVNCWDLLHSSDNLNREFVKICGVLNFEPWLSTFLVDYLTYKDKHEDALRRLENDINILPLPKMILKAEIFFVQKNFIKCYETIRDVLSILPSNLGELSNNLVVGGMQRHLHFLPMTRIAIMQFCSKMLLRAIGSNGFKTDMSVGHCFVLLQMDWPNEEDTLPSLLNEICRTKTFYYLPFQNYIVEIDILEELAYLFNSQDKFTFEIMPNMLTRRIGTRGADKGIKEEIRSALRKQTERSDEPMHELIEKFLITENTPISLSLL